MTWIVKFPEAVGVPDMAPAELIDRPPGSVVPEDKDHVYGGVPPVAARVVPV